MEGVIDTEAEIRTDTRIMVAEIAGIIKRMCDKLMTFTSTKGREGSDLRTAAGDLQTNVETSIRDGSLPEDMLVVFDAALAAGISVSQLDPVLAQLRSEVPTILGSLWTIQFGVLFALSCQCKIIAATTFKSRDDIEAMQERMKNSFDLAKEMAADDMDNIVYQLLRELAAKSARYLADTAMPLPRVVYYNLRQLPALATSYRIYSDASRFDEIVADNKVVHPAFVRGTVRALTV